MNEDCPQCGRDDSWTDYGCARCGLEFFPPSHAFQDASGLTIAERVARLRADWAADKPVPAMSPIETLFWAAWKTAPLGELAQFPLVPQHPVAVGSDRYRLDFALPGLMAGIELDGLAGHSSTTALAADHRRQRALELAGWKIARFGGQEVHRDAAWCVQQALRLINKRT